MDVVIFLRFELHCVDVQCWVGLGWVTSDYISRGLGWAKSVKSWVGLGWVGLQKMDQRPCLSGSHRKDTDPITSYKQPFMAN